MTDDEINKAVNDIRFYLNRLEERNKELEAALREILNVGYSTLDDNLHTLRMIADIALAGGRENWLQKTSAALGEKNDA